MNDFPMFCRQPIDGVTLGAGESTAADTVGDVAAFGPLLLDEIGLGLIVCDGFGAVRYANRAARSELDAGGLLVMRGAMLRGPVGSASMFERTLRQACVRGQRRVLTLESGGHRLTLSIAPLVHASPQAAFALVTLGRRGGCPGRGVELLAAAVGLTAAESRVLRGLVESRSPKAIALASGVSLATVRTQIASIRAKFGVGSVDALLIRVAELPPLADDDVPGQGSTSRSLVTLAARATREPSEASRERARA